MLIIAGLCVMELLKNAGREEEVPFNISSRKHRSMRYSKPPEARTRECKKNESSRASTTSVPHALTSIEH